ncbi:ABC transporter permease [Corticibacter populi]|uniref:Thiamine pyrimidine synthase n=1 Tax=Corticibacter populi TaxID=1550736 RepID=A0A3M6R039_9BURK|nr:ABC transporter substrate-binding protein [Corticibacter populi]RMX08608.1 ABC transporter permease [Corticibacter populi]RZS35936.1 NitT/TauT family transport system substrate-binding protein [Corticibacter populi]
MKRRSLLQAASVISALSLSPFGILRAQRKTPFKFNLGWKFEASGAGFFLAKQRGYYDEAGLDVTIDSGNGSTAAISLVASGAYDAASADLASMIEFNVKHPEAGLKAVAMQYDLNPNALIVRKGGPIAKPGDFAGKRILGQPFNASRKLFPVFAKAQGFDPSGVVWENMDPGVGDTRFAQGDFDAAAYFYFTGLLNLKGRGVDLDTLQVYRYCDYGMKSYGNGLVANPKSMANAEAMKAFVAASTRGWLDAIADPAAGGAAVKQQEPLANQALETERLQLITTGTMQTPDTTANGWGAATPERVQATIDETLDAFGLQAMLRPADIWDDAFLPPLEVRKLRV